MADEPNPSRNQKDRGWLHHVWIPILTALIVAAAAIVGAVIGRSTVNQSATTTVVKAVPPSNSELPESEPSPSPQPESPEQTAACLPSPAGGDAEDNSMGTPRGPLESGRVYRGTLIKGDEEWWGFCSASAGRVDVRVENVCDVQETGATNLIAEVFDSSGAEIESMRPDPGRFESIPIQVDANSLYYVHIFDINDVDIGGVCGEVPWTLVVTGDLTAELSA